jgi:predicted RecB family endonuclease
MRIFATQFEHDGKTYAGPNIIARDFEQAEAIAELKGIEVVGELTDYVYLEDDQPSTRTLH